ncbi:hypothetical protein [Nereida sp. MMG025]|uniref:hypothetical protein n=1 Tax=Nereida sp. MMG025 TaxID=2909981 RepID=UPI001F3D82D8|nr:hypothetical protein [Nereida sp. MMG025]MCF6444476.1 hypothetical protein [Nereida sp. MMG025]
MTPDDWPSLRPHLDLANTLFPTRGTALVGTWFDQQVARITDPDFARLFSDHIEWDGVVPSDYNHRHIRSAEGDLIGGIRFFGGDLTRPFVEVIAHSFDDLTAMARTVSAEWAVFNPRDLRLLVTPETPLPETARIDQHIFAGHRDDLPNGEQKATLRRFKDVDAAIKMVRDRYADLDHDMPALVQDIRAASDDQLREWRKDKTLMSIMNPNDPPYRTTDKTIVGLIAVSRGTIAWLEG